ncbi:MAG: pseudouridine synthase, partial [candidate division WOR-3 bacterium]
MARAGLTSRRKAKDLIKKGLVTINGKVVSEPFVQVNPEKDIVEFEGRKIEIPQNRTYIIFNKPKKVITTLSDEFGRTTVMDFISCKEKGLVPVGRLDEESEGLLLITNDGDLAHRLTHPSFEIEKEYEALIKEIESQSPELASLVSVDPMTFEEVQKIIPPDVKLLEYFVTSKKLFIFYITTIDFKIFEIDIEKSDLTSKVNGFRNSLDNSLITKD